MRFQVRLKYRMMKRSLAVEECLRRVLARVMQMEHTKVLEGNDAYGKGYLALLAFHLGSRWPVCSCFSSCCSVLSREQSRMRFLRLEHGRVLFSRRKLKGALFPGIGKEELRAVTPLPLKSQAHFITWQALFATPGPRILRLRVA